MNTRSKIKNHLQISCIGKRDGVLYPNLYTFSKPISIAAIRQDYYQKAGIIAYNDREAAFNPPVSEEDCFHTFEEGVVILNVNIQDLDSIIVHPEFDVDKLAIALNGKFILYIESTSICRERYIPAILIVPAQNEIEISDTYSKNFEKSLLTASEGFNITYAHS